MLSVCVCVFIAHVHLLSRNFNNLSVCIECVSVEYILNMCVEGACVWSVEYVCVLCLC